MKFDELLTLVGSEPLFESSVLLAGDVEPGSLRQQLTRWAAAGKIHQLRRGLYAVAAPYRSEEPHPFVVANSLMRPSYVSLQSALRYHGMIPEHVPVTTSITSGRPTEYDTQMGSFLFRHVDTKYFWGYDTVDLGGANAFVAEPAKALLDLVHLEPGGDDPAFLDALRLQNLSVIRLDRLREVIERWDKPKMRRAGDAIRELVERSEEWVDL